MSVNLRTKPIDRRRLSAQDKSDYNRVRSRKIAGARARRGMMAQRENMPIAHTAQKPGTGGFTQGLSLQQQRNRARGAEVRRSKALRPRADMSMEEIYQN